MSAIARKVAPARAVDAVREDQSDNRILECAAEAKSDYVVTGDKDLLRMDQFGGIPIITVAQFLERASSDFRL